MTNKNHEIKALEREGYELPKQAFAKVKHSVNGFWLSVKAQIVLTLVLTLCDGVVLFTLMDYVMMQNQFLGYITTVTFAFVLNFSAIIAAFILRHAIYKTQRAMWPLFGVTIVAFILLAGCITNLRYRAPEMYEAPSGTIELVNTVDVNDSPETLSVPDSHLERNYAIILLLSVSPVVTSLLNFLITFICADPVKSEYEALQLRNLELKEELSEIRSALLTMESIEDQALSTLKAVLKAEIGELIGRAHEMRAIAIQELESNLKGNHDAISVLSAEAMSTTSEFNRRLLDMQERAAKYSTGDSASRPQLYLATSNAAANMVADNVPDLQNQDVA